jgi:hypothetical protein
VTSFLPKLLAKAAFLTKETGWLGELGHDSSGISYEDGSLVLCAFMTANMSWHIACMSLV